MSNALSDAMRQFQNQHYRAAEKSCRLALEHSPENADAHHLIGALLSLRGKNNDAIKHIEKALALAPDNIEIRHNLARGYRNLGRYEDAISAFDTVLQSWPTHAEVWVEKGFTLGLQGKFDLSAKALQGAIELGAIRPDVYSELGRAQTNLYDFVSADAAFEQALELDPNYSTAKINLAVSKENQGQADQSIKLYDEIPRSDSCAKEALYRRALALLLVEDIPKGWDAYAQRHEWGLALTCHGQVSAPFWSGENLKGKSLLVWTEQGPGDEILLGSMLGELNAHDADITIACSPRIAPLFLRSFPSFRIVQRSETKLPVKEIGRVDYQASLTEIGAALRPTMEHFTAPKPFLNIEEKRRQDLRDKYTADSNRQPVVGISWRSANKEARAQKSLNLQDLTSALNAQAVRFVSLQYGVSAEEQAALEEQSGLSLYFDPDIDPLKDMDGFAHQVAAMDLVISTSNTTVHVAGGLGTPCWTILAQGTGRPWYWFQNRTESMWHPSMHLYRQQTAGDWSAPLADIHEDFKEWVEQWPTQA